MPISRPVLAPLHPVPEGSLDVGLFLDAQGGGVWERALEEVRAGRKRGCWSWFVFPQLHGCQSSASSVAYAIPSLADATAYLDHPVLGARLVEISEALLALEGVSPDRVFGPIDAEKVHQCMSLFDRARPGSVFGAVLAAHFGGRADSVTESLLAGIPTSPAR